MRGCERHDSIVDMTDVDATIDKKRRRIGAFAEEFLGQVFVPSTTRGVDHGYRQHDKF